MPAQARIVDHFRSPQKTFLELRMIIESKTAQTQRAFEYLKTRQIELAAFGASKQELRQIEDEAEKYRRRLERAES